MIVILCHPRDAAALWLHEAMRSLGIAGVELVAVEQLVYSRRIVYRHERRRRLRPHRACRRANAAPGGDHRPRQSRPVSADAALREGASGGPRLCRIRAQRVPARVDQWRRGSRDQSAAALRSRRRRVPAADRRASRVRWPACRPVAGVPMRPRDDSGTPPMSPTHAALVFDGRLYGALLPRQLQDGCRRLAVLLGAPLLQIRPAPIVRARLAIRRRVGCRGFPHRRQAAGARARAGIDAKSRRMILLAGIAEESPLALVTEALEAMRRGASRVRPAARGGRESHPRDRRCDGRRRDRRNADVRRRVHPPKRDQRDLRSADGRSIPPGDSRTAAALRRAHPLPPLPRAPVAIRRYRAGARAESADRCRIEPLEAVSGAGNSRRRLRHPGYAHHQRPARRRANSSSAPGRRAAARSTNR